MTNDAISSECGGPGTKARWRQAVVERLRHHTASRANVNGGAKPDLKIDPSGLWLEDDSFCLPRSNEAQSLGEQRFNKGVLTGAT
jgi:hypothetical protein